MLNLYKLEIFAMVVQAGSFSAAATHLYITQSAVSQHIHDLESGLGTQLFTRGPRGVELTPAGEKLYDYAQRILRLVAEAENAVTDVENLAGAQVSLSSTPGVSVYLLPDWLQGFRARFPNTVLSLATGITPQIVIDVLNHKLDLGFVEGETDEFTDPALGQVVLRETQLHLIVGAAHSWWDEETVSPAALNDQPFIMRQRNSGTYTWATHIFRDYHMNPRIVAELDNPEAIKRAVMSGMGISILPDYVIGDEPGLRTVKIDGVTLRRSIKLIWNRELPCSPLARALLTHLSQDFPQLLTITNRVQVGIS
ncbi:MAG: LysR family transcriptional regulator [Anaerolineae bacterium]|nr:LysR family transcriptional regulator [Anaerolineae bacterium]